MVFDTALTLGGGAAGPFTVSYTVTGPNAMLGVGILQDSATPPTVTFNGVSARIGPGTNAAISNPTYYLFQARLKVASTTTANIVVTKAAAATDLWADAASWNTDIEQTNTPDAEAGAEVTADPYTMALTTIADNCWLWGYGYDTDGTPSTAGANTVVRVTNAVASILKIFDSNGPRTPAGAHVLNVNGGTGPNVYRVESLAPTAAGGVTTITGQGRKHQGFIYARPYL